jgi:hypothetical protein
VSAPDNSISNVLVSATFHQRRGRVFLVLREVQRPQYLVHNRLKSSLFFAEDYIEQGVNAVVAMSHFMYRPLN